MEYGTDANPRGILVESVHREVAFKEQTEHGSFARNRLLYLAFWGYRLLHLLMIPNFRKLIAHLSSYHGVVYDHHDIADANQP